MRGRRPSPLDDSGARSTATRLAKRPTRASTGAVRGGDRSILPSIPGSSRGVRYLRLSPPRGCGGIGRRARFRSVSGRPGGGSSPLIRMTNALAATSGQVLLRLGAPTHAARGPASAVDRRHPSIRRQPCQRNGRREHRRPSPLPNAGAEAQRPVSRRWRRCATTSEKPIAIKSTPPPTVQRRSKPVKGSVDAFFAVGSVDVVGSLFVVSGAVVFVGVLLSFDGEVPVVGVGVGVGVDVGVGVGVVLLVVGLLL
jgi:hypothetical protein